MLRALAPALTAMRLPFGAAEPTPVFIGGQDISRWTIVDLDVPPGSLGIVMDENVMDGAVLARFEPVATDGRVGPIEQDTRVVVGSVLESVNEFDFVASQLTLEEIAQVMHGTAHMMRNLRFRVPPKIALENSTSNIEVAVQSKTQLLGTNAQNSSSPEDDENDGKSLKNTDNMSSFETKVSSASLDDVKLTVETTTTPSDTDEEIRAASPLSIAPVNPASPSPTPSAQHISVLAPPGPLGLHLDGNVTDRAVVVGFLPLPDRSRGVLEQRNEIPMGAVLQAVNGTSVTHLSLEEIRIRLGALAGMERRLSFEVPTAKPPASPRCASIETLSEIDQRRHLEMAVVLKFDRDTINRRECWLMVSTHWLAYWMSFVARRGPLPGRIGNDVLLESNWETRLQGNAPGRPDAPREGLTLMKDYRGVTPLVWCLLVALHGQGNVPVLARYMLDIYSEPVGHKKLTEMLREPHLQAEALVRKIREQYPTAFYQSD